MLSDMVKDSRIELVTDSLNPCSNGICSLTRMYDAVGLLRAGVLILVLMEYAL